MYSAKPPSTSQPVNSACSQRFSSPRRQKRQVSSVWCSQGTPTRSPTASGARARLAARRDELGAGAERHDLADDLVAGDDGRAVRRQLALEDVQVGAADAAGQHAEQHLARARARGTGSSTSRSGASAAGAGAASCIARIISHHDSTSLRRNTR